MSPRIASLGHFLLLTSALTLSLPAAAQFTGPADPTLASSSSSLPDAPSAIALAPPAAPLADDDHIPLDQKPHPQVELIQTPKHIFFDLGHIAISPIYIRKNDLKWILPLTGAAAAAFATDTHVVNDVVSHNPTLNDAAGNASDGLRDALIVTPVAMYAIGKFRGDDHARETGVLGSEAMVDAFVADEVIKLITFRERPYIDNGQGEFYTRNAGVDSSFISGHSMIAWSSAAVIAGEYHNKWARIGVYTLATGVSLNRVLGLQHFPTDVLLGSAGGWLIGHYVFRAHHHADLEAYHPR